MYHNGKYHLFFQYNPHGAVWGNMSWAHVVSEDLVTWKRLPVAMYNDETYDSYGVFSGSVTMVDGVPVVFYTCVREDKTQLQCIARPKDVQDPNLTEWVKDARNPVIPTLPEGCDATSFRWRERSACVCVCQEFILLKCVNCTEIRLPPGSRMANGGPFSPRA